jgi:N-acetylglucosaminyl-diphospho-decaprenol L-rhamnosyltransferase
MTSSARPVECISPSTSVVIVMFNSQSTVVECLSSIPRTCEVVLVDQCSSDASVSLAKRIRPDSKLIRAGANRGFGAGCNLGAANATGEVLIFLNPDASLGGDSVPILAESVRRTAALIGPRIIDPLGNDKTRARYWSNFASDLAEVFFPTKLLVGSLRRDIPAGHGIYQAGGRVSYVQGSCMAVRAKDFWQVDGFDERYFLYYEEEALARSLERIGVHVILEPLAVVTHIGGSSTSQFREFSVSQYYRSKALFYTHCYLGPVSAAFLCVLWILLQAMAVLTPVRRVVGLRPDHGRSWYHAAAAGLISGWHGRIVVPPNAREFLKP